MFFKITKTRPKTNSGWPWRLRLPKTSICEWRSSLHSQIQVEYKLGLSSFKMDWGRVENCPVLWVKIGNSFLKSWTKNVIQAKEKRDHLVCYQSKSQHQWRWGCISAHGIIGNLHICDYIINADTGFGATYAAKKKCLLGRPWSYSSHFTSSKTQTLLVKESEW